MADRTGLSGTQAGGRAWTLRGARMARLPPSRNTLHRRLRLPDLREGDDSPLRTSRRPEAPETSRSRRLPTQRRRRSDPSATSRTRSPPCADATPSLSQGASNDVPAATLRANKRLRSETYDAVRLALY